MNVIRGWFARIFSDPQAVILALLLVDVFDTAGTLVGVATRGRLIGPDGRVVKTFGSAVKPLSRAVTGQIDALLCPGPQDPHYLPAKPHCARLDHVQPFVGLRPDNAGHAALDDPRLFGGDLGEGVTQVHRMIVADGRDRNLVLL